ncbi:uracil-O(2)--methyltransferase [Xylariales sp. PMI_506]|nr:uracil-O(2)--methyltransferase [Xylariales sp. PMI_506]
MGFEPTEYAAGAPPVIEGSASAASWTPLFKHACNFNKDIFLKVMMNMIRNPNVNSSWLFRADILLEMKANEMINASTSIEAQPRMLDFEDFELSQTLVRKLIPRNTLRDQPLDQTCLVYQGIPPSETVRSLVVYNPHYSSETEVPFYHPQVRGIAFLHEWNSDVAEGVISIHYSFFRGEDRAQKLVRTAFNLLSVLHKHGQGAVAGYVKRVHHDTIIPQIPVQNTYTRLKQKYARKLINTWAEVTDPTKHVFEDLGIAAFLIELWAEVYKDVEFPGFVDIGCGNGLLVYILREEGYPGWGFDARTRKSWGQYNKQGVDATPPPDQEPSLCQHVLLPSIINKDPTQGKSVCAKHNDDSTALSEDDRGLIHDGRFPKGTFIISNHADELTPWTPLLATASECPFIMIPCCSHDLSGSRYRAPAPKGHDKASSAYASLVAWVSQIAADCGWEVETEMLRIPSTRNTGLVGRKRTKEYSVVDLDEIMKKYGGTEGYVENVMKLVNTAPRGH